MTKRGSPALVIALALVCVFTPQIRQPIQALLGTYSTSPWYATERYMSRELNNLNTWVHDLGQPFTGGK